MFYEEVTPISREEAERVFGGNDQTAIVKALLSIAYHDPDGHWVQERCLDLLNNPSETVRGAAVTCLGHLARIHRKLDLAIVLPVLQALRSQPALTGKVEDALDDISMFVGANPGDGSNSLPGSAAGMSPSHPTDPDPST